MSLYHFTIRIVSRSISVAANGVIAFFVAE